MNAKPGPLPESIVTIRAVVVSATADLPSELVTQRSESGGPLGTSLIMRMSDPNSLDVCFNRCRAEPLLRRLICINLCLPSVARPGTSATISLITLPFFQTSALPNVARNYLKVATLSGLAEQSRPKCPSSPQLQHFPVLFALLQSRTWWLKARQRSSPGRQLRVPDHTIY